MFQIEYDAICRRTKKLEVDTTQVTTTNADKQAITIDKNCNATTQQDVTTPALGIVRRLCALKYLLSISYFTRWMIHQSI